MKRLEFLQLQQCAAYQASLGAGLLGETFFFQKCQVKATTQPC